MVGEIVRYFENSCEEIDYFHARRGILARGPRQDRDEQVEGFFYHLHRDEDYRSVVRVQQLEEDLDSVLDAVGQGSTEPLTHLSIPLKGPLEISDQRRRHRQSDGRVPFPRKRTQLSR